MTDRELAGPEGLAAEALAAREAGDVGPELDALRARVQGFDPEPAPDPEATLWDAIRKAKAAATDAEALEALAAAWPPVLRTVSDLRADPIPPRVLWRDVHGERGAWLSAGEVGILAGPGGLGKSSVLLAVAHAAATAGEGEGRACGLAVRGAPVVVASYEDSAVRLAHRLRWFAGDDDVPGLFAWPDPSPLWIADPDAGALEGPGWRDFWAAVRSAGARLVILDPLSAALADVSASDMTPVRGFLRALSTEAAEAGAAVLLVAHDTKSARNAARAGEDPGAGVVAGSAAWYDGARGVLTLARLPGDDGERLILRCVKANYGPDGWGALLQTRWEGGRWRGFTFDRSLDPDQVAARIAEGVRAERKRAREPSANGRGNRDAVNV